MGRATNPTLEEYTIAIKEKHNSYASIRRNKNKTRRNKNKARRINKKRTVMQKTLGRCFYCNEKFPASMITIDHFIPKSKGGTNSIDNLVPACRDCNHDKGTEDGEKFKSKLMEK